jgi:hypothetical protein
MNKKKEKKNLRNTKDKDEVEKKLFQKNLMRFF